MCLIFLQAYSKTRVYYRLTALQYQSEIIFYFDIGATSS